MESLANTTNASINTSTTGLDPKAALDPRYNLSIRIACLYVIIIVGFVGGLAVLFWICNNRYNRRIKSRVNMLVIHVTMSDLLVICFTCVVQLIWEYAGKSWTLGEPACKMNKYAQIFSIMASNNMLAVLSLDRHQAIRAPLKRQLDVWKITLFGWIMAAVFASPVLFVFHVRATTDEFQNNRYVCENIFPKEVSIQRQIYAIYVFTITFLAPSVLIITCYLRIFLKIAQKANEGRRSSASAPRPGKVHLQSTPSSSLPRAKIKTLKMTVVIVTTFIVCSLPYQLMEVIWAYGDHSVVPPIVAAFFGTMAVANSATNPYVFLVFNATFTNCCGRIFNRRRSEDQVDLSSTSGANTETGHGSHMLQKIQSRRHDRSGSSVKTREFELSSREPKNSDTDTCMERKAKEGIRPEWNYVLVQNSDSDQPVSTKLDIL